VNVIANFVPQNTLRGLFKELYQINPVLPMCVDMKPCTFFKHNSERIKQYELQRAKFGEIKKMWDTLLQQRYGESNDLLEIFNTGETSKAFDRYELKIIEKTVEITDGLKFLHLPEIPFSIPTNKQPLFRVHDSAPDP
jgi:hypothetical protein